MTATRVWPGQPLDHTRAGGKAQVNRLKPSTEVILSANQRAQGRLLKLLEPLEPVLLLERLELFGPSAALTLNFEPGTLNRHFAARSSFSAAKMPV